MKNLFQSKTIVFNFIVALAGVVSYFWSPATDWVQSNAVLIMAIVGAANMLLRRITKNAYSFFPILVAMLCMLPSCTPQSYIVNTSPYTEAIQSNPDKVVVAPEHVTEVGGFQANIGGTVVTDYGAFSVDNDGVGADVVVDLRSGK